MSENKVATSHMLEFHLRNKLRRVASILGITESNLMEDALRYYFENSRISKSVMHKINEDAKLCKELGMTKTKEIQSFESFGYEYRPQNPEEDDF